MENRFGFKDLIYSIFLVLILASIWLAMVMFDRQHSSIQTITEQLNQQTASQARIERMLSQLQENIELGVPAVTIMPPASDAAEPLNDPFARLKQAKKQPDYAMGDYAIDAFPARVARITPLISSDFYSYRIQSRVLESLAGRDPDTLEWQPVLAKSWTISDDGLIITFQLRRGITFSDGHPLTAEDVQFSYDLIMDESIDAPRSRNYIKDKIQSVIATGPYEVVFTFREPYFQSFGMAGGLNVLPKHFYSRFTAEEINNKPGLLLGSGPYRMPNPTSWAPGAELVLLRNERYWGEQPAFGRLIYREINNDVARLTAFRNGDIDIFYRALAEQYVQMIRDEELVAGSQHFAVDRPINGYGYISWNQKHAGKATRFADKRVRQAMTMLTNRQRLIDDIMFGYGRIATGPFNPLSNQYDQEINPWPHDIQRAKQLLAEAGFLDRDGDGVIESADGEPFVFRLTYPSGSSFWDRVTLLLKDGFAEGGIVMQLDPLEWSVFSEKLESTDFDAVCLAWGSGIESDIYQMFHTDNIGDGADNFMSYSNPTLDGLIAKARLAVSESERMPLWKGCHRVLHEDQPYTFLYVRKFMIFIDDRFRNVQEIHIGLNDRTEWYVPSHLQQY